MVRKGTLPKFRQYTIGKIRNHEETSRIPKDIKGEEIKICEVSFKIVPCSHRHINSFIKSRNGRDKKKMAKIHKNSKSPLKQKAVIGMEKEIIH